MYLGWPHKIISFCCIGPYYVESFRYIIQAIFFVIVVSLKKDFIGNAVEYWNKRKSVSLTGTSGGGTRLLLVQQWVNWFEANHDDTKKFNPVRVPHWLVTKYLKFQLAKILWTAGTNNYRKPENSFYLKLFLQEVSLVFPKFIFF